MKKYVIALLVMTMMVTVGVSALAGDTIIWSGHSGEEEATKPLVNKMIADWNATHDIKVEWLGWPWAKSLEQHIIRARSGQKLNVAQIARGWQTPLADMLTDLEPLAGEEWLEENLYQSYVAGGRVGSKLLAIPWTSASIGMVYNPDLLERAGVKKVPTTIAEFEAVLEALKEYDSDIIPYAMVTKDAGSMGKDFLAWLWTFGGRLFDENNRVAVNSPEGIETVEWFKDLVKKGYIKMDISRFDARQLYAKNQVGFYDDAIMANKIAISNGMPEENIDDFIRPMLRPVLENGDEPQSILWGHLLVIFKHAENKEASADFIKHIISEEQSIEYFKQTGMLPVIKTALNSEVVKNDQWANRWIAITKTGKKEETEDFVNSSELKTIITEELQAALLDYKTTEKALDDMAARIEAAVK